MKRYRTRLPPLDTLVFFECAFRLRSFTRSAEELLVSQAAVSKRIRQLEDWLETPLFARDRRRLTPTDTGTKLGERVSSALDFIDQTLGNLRMPHDPVVRIASMSAIGMFWLQPRLRAFAFSDEACPYSLMLSDTSRDLLTEDFDLVLTYGDGVVPGWITHRLFDEELVPVASPSVADAVLNANDSRQLSRLDYRRVSPDWVNWPIWSQSQKCSFLDDLPRKICASYSQSIGLALEGKGIALGTLPMLADEIASGRLVSLPVDGVRTGRAYWLARPDGAAAHRGVTDAWKALTGETRW